MAERIQSLEMRTRAVRWVGWVGWVGWMLRDVLMIGKVENLKVGLAHPYLQ